MKIAVASGKGGTGKTTVALALAETLGSKARLLDCDVEEPNCHLFFPGEPETTRNVRVNIPHFSSELCNGCGICARECRFHALAKIGRKILLFPELCHSCGGCLVRCPRQAVTETEHSVGRLEFRSFHEMEILTGVMNVGSTMTLPVLRELKQYAKPDRINLLDAPPGTSCSMVETVRGCDFVILVTEPTPFGLHDLKLAQETLQYLNLPHGVVINRADENCGAIETFCRRKQIPLLMKIPFSRRIAEGYSTGQTLLTSAPELSSEFRELAGRMRQDGRKSS